MKTGLVIVFCGLASGALLATIAWFWGGQALLAAATLCVVSTMAGIACAWPERAQ